MGLKGTLQISILGSLLFAGAAWAVPFKGDWAGVKSISMLTEPKDTDISPNGTSYLAVRDGTFFTWRPTDNTKSPFALSIIGVTCSWKAGAGGSDLNINDERNGRILWICKANTDCDPSVVGACSTCRIPTGVMSSFNQVLNVNDGGVLSCEGRKQ